MSFKRLETDDIVISAESITSPAWSNNLVTLTGTNMVTSSTQVQSTAGDYYVQVWNGTPTLNSSELQYNIAYADKLGSGSIYIDPAIPGASPTRTVYRQYRNLIKGDEESEILFGGVAADYFHVISLERSRYKEKLLPGTFELTLASGSNSITLIDSSPYVTTQTFTDAGREYELYKKDGSSYTASLAETGSWGKLLPDVGLILLNTKALTAPTPAAGGISLQLVRGANSDNENSIPLYNAIKTGNSFKVTSEETVSSNFVFIRARNSEFNYSTNPSLITGSGEIRYNVMIEQPQSYITTIGLYNDANDLLAVAKLSRPLIKDFTKEALIRIKLDF